jgi:hypothetical protein
MAVYVVLRHPDAEQVWANAWMAGTCFIEAITTDATVAGQCEDAQRRGEYVYVHRLLCGGDKASVVSKAKVREVQKIDKTFYLVSFKDQLEVGREPLRPAEQGDRSYLAPPVDG